MKKSTQSVVSISRPTAEQAPVRALQFLRTVGTDTAICAALQKAGFELADLKEGWSLVLKASGTFNPEQLTVVSPSVDAIAKLDKWRTTHVSRARAALHRLHPEQEAFVFDNLILGTGATAVVSVAIFLDRIDALDNSPNRKSTRKADHAALATLDKRGITKGERKHARDLIAIIENNTAVGDKVIEPMPVDVRMPALIELHAWLQDWSESARAVLTRRDQLLRLGIGKRQKRTAAPPPVVTPPAPPAQAIADLPSPAVPMLPAAQLNGQSHHA